MNSIWSMQCDIEKRSCLKNDLETEVAVIGAGMAGILTAYLLQEAGKTVAILEADRIASGQTRNTTAKITSQHGLIYSKLINDFGIEKAQKYGAANEAAILEYKRIIESENIDCDFESQCSYVYSADKDKLISEADAAAKLGLPASFVSSIDITDNGAVRFSNQAQFNPLKFIKHISKKLNIYEETTVQNVHEHTIEADGGIIKAEHIVFACHYPFINFPGMYFTRLHQERSYVLALENTSFPDGMYIGDGENSYSIRHYGNYLLFGGENHRTGYNSKGGRYDALRKKAQELFPGCHEITHWSAQDCIPADGIPFIGRYSSKWPFWYVATGFQKWGMTSSMVSAMILRDIICGNENGYAEVFDPSRISSKELSGIACESGEAIKGLSKSFFRLPEITEKSLPVGHGGIVEIDEEKVGVYKKSVDEIYIVDVRCPHMGCQLEWNPDELSWDCPCHGSRFDYMGKLISNPAQSNIYLS